MRPKEVLDLEPWEEWVVLEGANRFYGGGETEEPKGAPGEGLTRTVKQTYDSFDLSALAAEGANVHTS